MSMSEKSREGSGEKNGKRSLLPAVITLVLLIIGTGGILQYAYWRYGWNPFQSTEAMEFRQGKGSDSNIEAVQGTRSDSNIEAGQGAENAPNMEAGEEKTEGHGNEAADNQTEAVPADGLEKASKTEHSYEMKEAQEYEKNSESLDSDQANQNQALDVSDNGSRVETSILFDNADQNQASAVSDNMDQNQASAELDNMNQNQASAVSDNMGQNQASTVPDNSDQSQTSAVSDNMNQDQASSASYHTYTKNSGSVDASYFEDALFIGDSRTEGLKIYSSLEDMHAYCSKGLSVSRAYTDRVAVLPDGQKVTILEALKIESYQKIYIMFGVNELGWKNIDIFYQKFDTLVADIKELQPQALIYVQSILPISAARSATDPVFNNDRVIRFNEALQRVCQDQNVIYLDVGTYLADDTGALPADASSDGIHCNRIYCEKWLDYLKENTYSWVVSKETEE